jgi:hypothetical protein
MQLRLLEISLFLLAVLAANRGSSADLYAFPWGCAPTQRPLQSPYQTLPAANSNRHLRDASAPVQQLPPKQAYAYGWFGSQPPTHLHSQWGSHSGFYQNFTQWTGRQP